MSAFPSSKIRVSLWIIIILLKTWMWLWSCYCIVVIVIASSEDHGFDLIIIHGIIMLLSYCCWLSVLFSNHRVGMGLRARQCFSIGMVRVLGTGTRVSCNIILGLLRWSLLTISKPFTKICVGTGHRVHICKHH